MFQPCSFGSFLKASLSRMKTSANPRSRPFLTVFLCEFRVLRFLWRKWKVQGHQCRQRKPITTRSIFPLLSITTSTAESSSSSATSSRKTIRMGFPSSNSSTQYWQPSQRSWKKPCTRAPCLPYPPLRTCFRCKTPEMTFYLVVDRISRRTRTNFRTPYNPSAPCSLAVSPCFLRI